MIVDAFKYGAEATKKMMPKQMNKLTLVVKLVLSLIREISFIHKYKTWFKEFDKRAPEFMKGDYYRQRYISNDEMKYSLRSLEKFCQDLGTVFIVTSSRLPKWLNTEHPKIQIVRHEEIISDEFLPTFNSSVIEPLRPILPAVGTWDPMMEYQCAKLPP